MENLNFKRALDNKNWYIAKIQINGEAYTVNMLRFENPSCYGIAEGRISKLCIFSKKEEALWYERGWINTTPRFNVKEIQKLYEGIIEQFN